MKYTRLQMLNQLIMAEMEYIQERINKMEHQEQTEEEFILECRETYQKMTDKELQEYHQNRVDGYYGSEEDVQKILKYDEKEAEKPEIKKYLFTEKEIDRKTKRKIGVYGSSFDPVTNVHLWTASTVAHRAKMDKVIFLPSSNKRIDKEIQTSSEHRLNMLKLAVENNPKFEVDPYELGKEGYDIDTYSTMNYFRKKYPDDEVYFIMGADLLVDIGKGKWRNSEKLVKENKFIVMARDGIDMLKTISSSPVLRNEDDGTKYHLIDKGLSMEISSTYIRDEFAKGGEPRYLLPSKCYDYAIKNNLYK